MVATRQRARRVSGALLVVGFALMIPGVAFALASQTGTDAVPPTFATHAGGVLLIGTVSLTLLGLTGFASLLWSSGDRTLSSAGAAAYAVAAAAWVIATGRAFALHVWTYELEVVFIVASALAIDRVRGVGAADGRRLPPNGMAGGRLGHRGVDRVRASLRGIPTARDAVRAPDDRRRPPAT